MVPIEHINLKHVENIISLHDLHIDLYMHPSGKLALSIPLEEPPGIAYFAIEPQILNLFVSSIITLQELFTNSPSLFIEICEADATRLYMRHDINIIIKCGKMRFSDLKHMEQAAKLHLQ